MANRNWKSCEKNLRTKRGVYHVEHLRRSKMFPGHNDYLVRTSSGGTIIALGWDPKKKDWNLHSHYGFSQAGHDRAVYEFKTRQDFKRPVKM